jgi:hypothetical protein
MIQTTVSRHHCIKNRDNSARHPANAMVEPDRRASSYTTRDVDRQNGQVGCETFRRIRATGTY